MSLILKLLGWTGLPTWVLELLTILAFCAMATGAVLWWEHKEIEKGVQEQQQADERALKQLQVQVDAESKALEQRAKDAEAAYGKEHEAYTQYQSTHPVLSAVQLCNPPHGGSRPLPQASTAHPADATGTAPARVGSPMPGADPPGAPDRLRLLQAFAALLDDQSAVIREYQRR